MTAVECQTTSERASLYINGALSETEAQEFELHLSKCEACSETLRQVRAVHGLMEYIDAEAGSHSSGLQLAAPVRAGWGERLSGMPWWLVSCSLHVLIIALAGLVSMAIALPHSDDSVIMVTELQSRPDTKTEDEKQAKTESALESKLEQAASDPTSTESSDIVVPPDILAKAELGDHFETINPDRPDTHSAYGVEEARSFHAVSGSAEPAGGGGTGGIGMEDVIGVGGAGTKGTGGGFGGGDGSGVGVGSGAGKGSFGNRNGGGRKLMVKKFGGTPATEGAVDRGLEWLARNQEADGHWDCAKHGGDKGEKASGEATDVAVTGLAVLAFLGGGHTERAGKYKDNVIKGLDWLINRQNEKTGMVCTYGYSHAIAGMALAEAAGMGRVKRTRDAAQKAVDATCFMQLGSPSEKHGWTYVRPQAEADIQKGGDGDISNSGFHMMFLKSAKVAGLNISPLNIEGIYRYLDGCEQSKDKAKDDPYFVRWYGYCPEGCQNTSSNALRTAIGLLCRQFFGTPPDQLESSVANCIKWGELPHSGLVADGAKYDGEHHDLYYTYYATLMCFQEGGDIWKRWNEALKKALLPTQIKGGADDGSWTPRGPQDSATQGYLCWGRVGQTALSILCMEVYYRYQKLSH